MSVWIVLCSVSKSIPAKMVSPSYGIQGSELIQKVTDGIRAVGTPILGSDKRWESAQWLLLIASL